MTDAAVAERDLTVVGGAEVETYRLDDKLGRGV